MIRKLINWCIIKTIWIILETTLTWKWKRLSIKSSPGATFNFIVDSYNDILKEKGLWGVISTYRLVLSEFKELKWTKVAGLGLSPDNQTKFVAEPRGFQLLTEFIREIGHLNRRAVTLIIIKSMFRLILSAALIPIFVLTLWDIFGKLILVASVLSTAHLAALSLDIIPSELEGLQHIVAFCREVVAESWNRVLGISGPLLDKWGTLWGEAKGIASGDSQHQSENTPDIKPKSYGKVAVPHRSVTELPSKDNLFYEGFSMLWGLLIPLAGAITYLYSIEAGKLAAGNLEASDLQRIKILITTISVSILNWIFLSDVDSDTLIKDVKSDNSKSLPNALFSENGHARILEEPTDQKEIIKRINDPFSDLEKDDNILFPKKDLDRSGPKDPPSHTVWAADSELTELEQELGPSGAVLEKPITSSSGTAGASKPSWSSRLFGDDTVNRPRGTSVSSVLSSDSEILSQEAQSKWAGKATEQPQEVKAPESLEESSIYFIDRIHEDSETTPAGAISNGASEATVPLMSIADGTVTPTQANSVTPKATNSELPTPLFEGPNDGTTWSLKDVLPDWGPLDSKSAPDLESKTQDVPNLAFVHHLAEKDPSGFREWLTENDPAALESDVYKEWLKDHPLPESEESEGEEVNTTLVDLPSSPEVRDEGYTSVVASSKPLEELNLEKPSGPKIFTSDIPVEEGILSEDEEDDASDEEGEENSEE